MVADRRATRTGVAGLVVAVVLVTGGIGSARAATVPQAPRPAATTPSGLAAAAACLDRAHHVGVGGLQTGRFTQDLQADEAVDAQTAMWLDADNWPISFAGGSNSCWWGGRVFGTYSQYTPWSTFHHTGGLNFENDHLTIVGLRVHNYGDGIRAREGASDFTISGVHLSFMHDDCVENDQLYSGVVEDSLLDGCYVGFSARPSKGDQVDGHTNTYTIRNNLVRLQATPTVYKGRAPGHGGFFKWDENAKTSPKLVVRDNVFRVDSRPNHQTLGLPAGYDVRCSDNVVVWLGKGRYPDKLPKCFTVTRDRRVWDRAVAQWRAAHPLNP
ncbi:MAG: hypothetical protein JJE46_14520 [Acidimicrobiia bacterium]|nr:hypothetical protein [Acidimicrobiia bacterium]